MQILSGRFWLIIGIVFGLLLFGMATLQGGVIILTIPFLIYLAVAIIFAPPEMQFKADRQIDAPVVAQNSPVQVRISIKHEGPGADELYIMDEPPPQLEPIQGQTMQLRPLQSGEAFEYDYTVRCARGRYFFSGITITLGEHFGLLQRRIPLPIAGEIRSVPEVPRLRKIFISPQQTRGFSGPIPSRQGGSGMIFWGVREYNMGDYLRRINWKVSSRHLQDLFTNEYEQERIADVGLILDAREKTNISVDALSLFEYSVLATASLAEYFLADGHRVSLLAYGYSLERVFPGYGKVHKKRIYHALAQMETGTNYALENFNFLPTRLFPARCQLVMISPLQPRDYPAIVRLITAGYDVMLISPDPVEFEAKSFDVSPELQQAIRLARVERSVLLHKLARLGVRVVNWQVDQPFEQTIYTALGRRPLFRRNLRAVSR